MSSEIELLEKKLEKKLNKNTRKEINTKKTKINISRVHELAANIRNNLMAQEEHAHSLR